MRAGGGGTLVSTIKDIAQLLPASEEKNSILEELIKEYVNDGLRVAQEIARLRSRELTIAEWQAMLGVLIEGRPHRVLKDWAIAIEILKKHFPKVPERDTTIRKFCERILDNVGCANYLEEIATELSIQQERDEMLRRALEKEFESGNSTLSLYVGCLAAALSNQRERDKTLERIFLRFLDANDYEDAKKTAVLIVNVQKREELLKKLLPL